MLVSLGWAWGWTVFILHYIIFLIQVRLGIHLKIIYLSRVSHWIQYHCLHKSLHQHIHPYHCHTCSHYHTCSSMSITSVAVSLACFDPMLDRISCCNNNCLWCSVIISRWSNFTSHFSCAVELWMLSHKWWTGVSSETSSGGSLKPDQILEVLADHWCAVQMLPFGNLVISCTMRECCQMATW